MEEENSKLQEELQVQKKAISEVESGMLQWHFCDDGEWNNIVLVGGCQPALLVKSWVLDSGDLYLNPTLISILAGLRPVLVLKNLILFEYIKLAHESAILSF